MSSRRKKVLLGVMAIAIPCLIKVSAQQMKKINVIIATVASILVLSVLSSCIKESNEFSDEGSDASKVSLKVGIATRAGAEPNSEINTVRIICFSLTGNYISSDYFPSYSEGVNILFETYTGNRLFYVICNETAAMAAALSGTPTEDQVKNTIYTHPTPLTGMTHSTPLPMVGTITALIEKDAADNVYITPQGGSRGNVLTVSVKRMMSRLSISLIKGVEMDGYTISDVKVRVCNIPTHSFLGDIAFPENAAFGTNIPLEAIGTLSTSGSYSPDYTTEASVSRINTKELYIPKNNPATTDRCTYLFVTAKFTATDASGKVYNPSYRIDLPNSMTGDSHTLVGNTHYNVYGKFVDISSVGLYADIKAMDVKDVEVGWKPLEGLAIVSDKTVHFGKNVNVTNNRDVYSGILKVTKTNVFYDVLFKYGSLVAMSGDATSGTFADEIKWKPSTFTDILTDWTSIPSLASGDVEHTAANIAAGLGDPCKLAGLSNDLIQTGTIDNNGWHMANTEEMNRLILANDNPDPEFINDNKGYYTFHSLLIPPTQFRNTSGVLAASSDGEYWTSQGASVFKLNKQSNTAAIQATQNPKNGFTIRCVRNVIPESVMTVTQPGTAGHPGTITVGGAFTVFTTSIPYWTAELITSGAEVGTSTDFNDFSFGSRTTETEAAVHTISGTPTLTRARRVYIAPKAIPYPNNRTFNFKVSGIGYDGQVIERVATSTQSYFYWTTKPSITAGLTGGRITSAGNTLTVVVTIAPNVPYVSPDTSKTIWLAVKTEGHESATPPLQITAGQYEYSFDVTIPVNNTPGSRGVTFTGMTDITPANIKIGENYVTIIQDK